MDRDDVAEFCGIRGELGGLGNCGICNVVKDHHLLTCSLVIC